jgi:hypothetical protein
MTCTNSLLNWTQRRPNIDLEYLTYSRKWAIPVKFIESPGRDLNSRFVPQEPLTTRCIYSADDDFIVPPAAIEFAFQTWRMTTAPIVGFSARARSIDTFDDWTYEINNTTMPYSMILVSLAWKSSSLFVGRYH